MNKYEYFNKRRRFSKWLIDMKLLSDTSYTDPVCHQVNMAAPYLMIFSSFTKCTPTHLLMGFSSLLIALFYFFSLILLVSLCFFVTTYHFLLNLVVIQFNLSQTVYVFHMFELIILFYLLPAFSTWLFLLKRCIQLSVLYTSLIYKFLSFFWYHKFIKFYFSSRISH